MDLDRRRQRGFELRQRLLDLVDCRDDVGARLALDRDDDGWLGVHPARQIHILRRDDGPADIANAYRPAACRSSGAVGEDVVVEPLRRHQLIVGLQRKRLIGAVQCAFRLVDRGRGQCRSHRLQVEALRRQLRRVDLHPDRRVLLAADADKADARHLRNLLRQDAVGVIADRGERQVSARSAPASAPACRPGWSCGRSADLASSAAVGRPSH